MAETITLDPAAVATSRTALDITPFISAEGPDYGDAAIEGYMAQGERGDTLVDYRIPNRTVVIPLRLTARGATSFDTIRRNLQAKVSLFQREGGWLSRTTSVGTLYGDIVNATLRLGGDWLQANKSIDVNAVLTLELVPDWYGTEVSLDDKTETTLPTYTKVMQVSSVDAVIAGDYPGRVRIVVDDDDNDTRRGLLWGWRSRHYSSATTAALLYQAEALTPLDTAAVSGGFSGASGTSTMTHAALGVDWTPMLSTQILSGSAHMTHTGTYRVWARIYTDNVGTGLQVRFVWDVGDLTNPTYNTPQSLPLGDQFYLVDLGEVRLDSVPVGTHRWQGQIQGKREAGTEQCWVDTLEFQPIDDGGGRLVADASVEPGLVAYTARESFDHAAGDLTSKNVLPAGTWAEAGDADGLVLNTTDHTGTRTAVSDTEAHFARAGASTPSAVAVQVDVKWSVATAGFYGALARYSSTTSNIAAVIDVQSNEFQLSRQSAAGVLTNYAAVTIPYLLSVDTWYTIRLFVDASGGVFWGWLWPTATGAPGAPLFTGAATDLATGGAQSVGQVGIFDLHSVATASTRTYDNFLAWIPNTDAVIYAQQSAELRTDGIFREDAVGAAYGPVIPQSGGLPRIPVSGLESRKVELYLRASRGDFDQVPDSGIDDISARVHYRPSWLTAPGS